MHPLRVAFRKSVEPQPTAFDAWPDARLQNELILNAAGEGIYGLDLEGRATFVNPAAASMTGHSVQELAGASMHQIVHHSHCDGSPYDSRQCPIYAAFRDGLIRNVGDEVFWRKDGTSFPVEYTSTPILRDGRLAGAVVVFRDITMRRQTETRLRLALDEVRRLKEQLQHENHSLRREIQRVRSAKTIVGSSRALEETLDLVARAAATDSTILVLGETGTGKELVARAIHEASSRRHGPMIAVSCGAISPALIESELFGHERGSFTGAAHQRKGRFEQARGGTLLLDEIAELPLDAQAKLLRVLQEREFERVGGSETVELDARIIAATHRDLGRLVVEGRFRQDLYYRLNVLPLVIPPLRARREDIPDLARHFLREVEARWGRSVGRISPELAEQLMAYDWPGNVRELQNVIERAALAATGTTLRLPLDFGSTGPRHETAGCDGDGATAQRLREAGRRLDDVEREHILSVLDQTRWRISGPHGASVVLGLHPNTLRYRMKKLGIARG